MCKALKEVKSLATQGSKRSSVGISVGIIVERSWRGTQSYIRQQSLPDHGKDCGLDLMSNSGHERIVSRRVLCSGNPGRCENTGLEGGCWTSS